MAAITTHYELKGLADSEEAGREDEPNYWSRLEHRGHLVATGGTTAGAGISLYGAHSPS